MYNTSRNTCASAANAKMSEAILMALCEACMEETNHYRHIEFLAFNIIGMKGTRIY